MGALAPVLSSAASSIAAGASSAVEGAAGLASTAAVGAYDAGKEMLSNAWKDATSFVAKDEAGNIDKMKTAENAAYEAGKALFSNSYGAQEPPSAPMNDQPQVVHANAQAPDAKTELERLMSNVG